MYSYMYIHIYIYIFMCTRHRALRLGCDWARQFCFFDFCSPPFPYYLYLDTFPIRTGVASRIPWLSRAAFENHGFCYKPFKHPTKH